MFRKFVPTDNNWRKAFKRKKRRTLQKRLRRGLTRNCQTLYKRTTVQQTHLILKHVECRWRENVQRSSPQNTGRAEKATALLLEKCDLRHAREARTFYTLLHRNVPKNEGGHSGG